MSIDSVPMTQEGYDKLKADLDHMQNVLMPELARRIAEARSEGDLSENAEYQGTRQEQGFLQARIDLLKDKLSRAYIVDPASLPQDTVVFGARVTIKDLDSGEQTTYELVGPGFEDYDQNKILTSSPRGQALLGKKVGDKVLITVPRGQLRYEILKISIGEAK
jgi:transcription elongation factor GreA